MKRLSVKPPAAGARRSRMTDEEKLRTEIQARDQKDAKALKGPLHPSVSLLSKLGSIAVHADELTSASGHHNDAIALRGLLADSEVNRWLEAMGAFIPVDRRSDPRIHRRINDAE